MNTSKKSIPFDILVDAIDGNFDTWREHYDNLSITDLIWLHIGLYDFVGYNSRFAYRPIESMLLHILDKRDHLSIVELGCWRGVLASTILMNFSSKYISRYTGYDIDYKAISSVCTRDDRYKTIKCDRWFWDYSISGDIFISCHTLEHFNERQLNFIFSSVAAGNVDYLVLEVPFLRPEQTWYGKNNSHILDISVDRFADIAGHYGYELFKNDMTSCGSKDHYYDVFLMGLSKNGK